MRKVPDRSFPVDDKLINEPFYEPKKAMLKKPIKKKPPVQERIIKTKDGELEDTQKRPALKIGKGEALLMCHYDIKVNMGNYESSGAGMSITRIVEDDPQVIEKESKKMSDQIDEFLNERIDFLDALKSTK